MRVRSFLLAWIAGGWLAGLGAAAMFGAAAWPLLLAAGALSATVAIFRRDAALLALSFAMCAAFAGGIARELTREQALPSDAVARMHGGVAREMLVRGVVRDDPDRGDTAQRFAVSVRERYIDNAWVPASGGVLVTAALLPAYRAGDIVELEGTVGPPPALEEFDYAAYLARDGIHSVAGFPEIDRIGRDERGVLRRAQLEVRRSLSRGLTLALPEPQASLAQGVLLGERSALPDDVERDLNATNTSHLVVVSGSNVVLVSAFLAGALGWLVGRRRALVLSLAGVAAYCALVGFSPPVARAFVMGVLLVVATATGRRTSGATSILFAAAVMAGIDPPILRDVSFQLSFAATAGIVYLSDPMRHALVQLAGWLLRTDDVPRAVGATLIEPSAVTIAATFAITPLLAMHFERISLAGLPANMLVVPLFPYILTAAALAAVGGLTPHLHLVLGFPAYVLYSYWLYVAESIAAIPGASATAAGYGARWTLATYAALAALTPMLARVLRRGEAQLAPTRWRDWRRTRRLAAFAVPAGVLVTTAAFAWWPSESARLEVTVLDVGQGDAILIETPAGHDILIDGGPGPAVLRALSAELPWRDRSLDLVVLTHAQADHATGLIDVLDRYDVRRAASNGAPPDGAAAAKWSDAVADEGLAIETLYTGDAIDLGDGVRLEVLWPPAASAQPAANDASIVLRISWGDVSFLLTGDIAAETERELLASGVDLSATVLKVAHHGSAGSSSARFLDEVQPAVAVVSAGRDNRFGHPAPDAVERLRARTELYVTADDGTVRFITDGERLWVDAR